KKRFGNLSATHHRRKPASRSHKSCETERYRNPSSPNRSRGKPIPARARGECRRRVGRREVRRSKWQRVETCEPITAKAGYRPARGRYRLPPLRQEESQLSGERSGFLEHNHVLP